MTRRWEFQWQRGATRPNAMSTFVEPDEFVRLLLSRRVLVRSDAGNRNVQGLLDVNSGRRFLIQKSRLLQA
jgi:hypothetical protein